jgi:hypothetical protein
MVISSKIIERAMGNRGSKADFNINLISVKEQRVDGSCCRGAKIHAIKVYSNRAKIFVLYLTIYLTKLE